MADNIIYGLVDPRTLMVRYVGLSSRGLVRPNEHRSNRSLKVDSYKNRWLKQLFAIGLNYQTVVLEQLSSADELARRIVKVRLNYKVDHCGPK